MNNFELMKSVQENTQIEEIEFTLESLYIYIKGHSEGLKFDKIDYYDFLIADGFVMNCADPDDQIAELTEYDHRQNKNDAPFHYLLHEVESIERRERLKTAALPDLSFATTQLKNLL